MESTYAHPNPTLNKITQYGAVVMLVMMLVATVMQLYAGLTNGRLGMLIVGALITLALALPVLMLTTMTPPVTVNADGVTIHPLIWRDQFIPWRDVRAFKDYPLLPPQDSEVGRKLMVGRRKYRPAEGKMLVVPTLPIQYRVNGFFTGEGWTPVIALTNRTHTDYEQLIHKVEIHCEQTRQTTPQTER